MILIFQSSNLDLSISLNIGGSGSLGLSGCLIDCGGIVRFALSASKSRGLGGCGVGGGGGDGGGKVEMPAEF